MTQLLRIMSPDGTEWGRCESGNPDARVAADNLGVGATVLTADERVIYRCDCPVPLRLSPAPKLTPGGFLYRQMPHPLCGTSKDRAQRGDPGHCEDCCAVGHLHAHDDLGCGDVGCTRDHDDHGVLFLPDLDPISSPAADAVAAARAFRTLDPDPLDEVTPTAKHTTSIVLYDDHENVVRRIVIDHDGPVRVFESEGDRVVRVPSVRLVTDRAASMGD